MNAVDIAGDVGSGAGSGEFLHVASTVAGVVPAWAMGVATVCVVLPITSWMRRRCAVSMLIAVWAFVSLGNLASIGRSFLGMNNDYWRWVDYGVGVLVDLVAVLYACSTRSPCVILFGITTIALFAADLAYAPHIALEVAWHVAAYVLLTIIPGNLPLSPDAPDYYYRRRRERLADEERRRREARFVMLPREEKWDSENPSVSYPSLFIPPRDRNYFQ